MNITLYRSYHTVSYCFSLNEKTKPNRGRPRLRIPSSKSIKEMDNEVDGPDDLSAVEVAQGKIAAELAKQINSIDRQKTFKGTKVNIF